MNNSVSIEYHWCGRVRTLYFNVIDGMTYLMKPQPIHPLKRRTVNKLKKNCRAELDIETNTIQIVP